MEFKNGQACWNGPIRSLKVHLVLTLSPSLTLTLTLTLTRTLTLTLTRTRACMQFWENKCDDDGICGVETFDDEA